MPEEKNKKLGLFALVCIGAGQVIGAGIITTTGAAIAQTGRATWLAYATAVLCGTLWCLPTVFFSSIAKYKGGAYTMVTATLGQQAGGLYSLWWLMMWLTLSLMGKSMGVYINSLFPSLNPNIVGIVFITIFYLLNIFGGIQLMAKVQKFLTSFLIFTLCAFAVIGCFHLTDGTFDFSSPDYYLNGGTGFLGAVMLLVYSTSGHSLVATFSYDAKNPKKDIPKAILITSGILFVLYTVIALVAANVLPVETVAGKPLTYVAKNIFPGVFFILFIVGGPIMALATTMNSGFATMAAPALGGIRNGWLPVELGKRNKYGVPWICYTIRYLCGIIPLMLNASITSITMYSVMVQRLGGILISLGGLMIPIKFKDAWEKSWLHMPNWLYYGINGLGLLLNIGAVLFTFSTYSAPLLIGNICVVLALSAVALIRYAKGKTHVNVTYSVDEDEEIDD